MREKTGPVALRYPRGGEGEYADDHSREDATVLREGDDVTIVTYGITVNAVLPGAIPTKINSWQFADPAMREKFRAGSVLGELGDAAYIAGAVEYFISDEARWTTGALLSVDGGYTL